MNHDVDGCDDPDCLARNGQPVSHGLMDNIFVYVRIANERITELEAALRPFAAAWNGRESDSEGGQPYVNVISPPGEAYRDAAEAMILDEKALHNKVLCETEKWSPEDAE